MTKLPDRDREESPNGGGADSAYVSGTESTTSVSATGASIGVCEDAKITISASEVEELRVDNLWTDWELVGKEMDGGQFSNRISTQGECEFVWNSIQSSADVSLTVSPPSRYVGGTYIISTIATRNSQSSRTTVRITINAVPLRSEIDCSLEIKGPESPGMGSFDQLIPELMNDWDIPGGSVAVAKNGRLVFTHGYGISADDCNSAVQPETRFRVASVSKPITSVTVLRLKEEGSLGLDQKAFEILDHLKPSSEYIDSRINDITIRHLLQHSGGWDIDQLGYDPMFRSEKIANAEGTTPPASVETIIRYMLKRDLNFDPGTQYAYSNFGYAVLGRIIEEKTGESYGTYVSDNVLDKMGISRMYLAETALTDRGNDESMYFGNFRTDSVFPDNCQVPSPYGGFYIEAMDAHGGWVASPIDLLRFMTHVDARDSVDDLLSQESIDTMTNRPDIQEWNDSNYYYGMGWNVRPDSGNWWHYGSLEGTTSILVRAGQNDLAWAAVFNTRPDDWNEFNLELDRTLWDAIGQVTDWPEHDLFEQFL